MRNYQIDISTLGCGERRFIFSEDDVGRIRMASVGRPFDLDGYIAYRSADQRLALSRKPAHVESVVLPYAELCVKLAEAQGANLNRASPESDPRKASDPCRAESLPP